MAYNIPTYPKATFPSSYGSGQFGQNRTYMEYMQRLANRMAAQQILEEEAQAAAMAAQPAFDPRAYFAQPEMPYLSGLSPMARFRDMALRSAGRYQQAGQNVRESAAGRGLVEDAAMGITRQPDGRVTTEAGGMIYPEQRGRRTLSSPYGEGSSTRGTSVPRGTFSFINAAGESVGAPFSALKDPRFMKYMREEELGRERRGVKASGKQRSFDEVMAQLDAV